jgi:hypothetical protein
MTRSMTRWTLAGCVALAAWGAVAGFDVEPATADSPTSVSITAFDPAGDTIFAHDAPFQDVIRAQLTRMACGDFKLFMEVAVPVPVAPLLPPAGKSQIWWMWAFDLDPAPLPRGYPWHDGGSQNQLGRPAEFIVYVSWDGTKFEGTAIDRRPLLTGGELILTSVPFRIDGKILQADLASEVIGTVPASFPWGPFTMSWSGPVGTEAARWADYFDGYFEDWAVFNP